MSRSNPTVNAPNPAVRWFQWNGEHGTVRYYDKDTKRNVDMPLPFTFMVLDEVGSVRGWDDNSDSGIYSNEVRDTRTDVLIVKAFKGGTLAEGIYKTIKDRVNVLGGQFVANCYIACKDNGNGLRIASLRLKGAALGAWMEFRRAHRSDLYKKAIAITGYTEGKKGRIVFRVPIFALHEVSEETNRIAIGLDTELQAWLTEYFGRTTHEQMAAPPPDGDQRVSNDDDELRQPLTDDDIPF